MAGLIWKDRKDEGASPVEHFTQLVTASVSTKQTENLILVNGQLVSAVALQEQAEGGGRKWGRAVEYRFLVQLGVSTDLSRSWLMSVPNAVSQMLIIFVILSKKHAAWCTNKLCILKRNKEVLTAAQQDCKFLSENDTQKKHSANMNSCGREN